MIRYRTLAAAVLASTLLGGCVAGAVIDTTASVVGGAVDAVIWTADAVTPDL